MLKGISFDVHKGEVVVILGPSGSGKSTILRCLNLLEKPTSGSIVFEGEDICAPSADVNDIRKRLGMVFQQFNLFPHLDALHNVMLAQEKVLKRSRKKRSALPSSSLHAWAWQTALTTSPTSYRAASSNAWPSRAPLP